VEQPPPADRPTDAPRSAASVPAPLALGLANPCPLPDLVIPPEWKSQPRGWGHSFHPMTSYLGAFPPTLAHALIARYSRPGDVVMDPFSGRGTVPLQACAERRVGAGSDANPLAALLTASKVDPPGCTEAEARLARLRIDWTVESDDWMAVAAAGPGALAEGPEGRLGTLPREVAAAFHVRTLAQLLFLRRRLDLGDPPDRFLAAAVTGILHGGSESYLSDAMPNGFALAPAAAARAMAARQEPRPERDVFDRLGAKLHRLYRDGVPAIRGVALRADARLAGERLRAALRARALPDRARLVVTSPPYLRTIRYGASNWLRLWFLGESPADVDARLDAPPALADYGRFLRDVLRGLRPALADDAIVVLVLGDVATDLGRPRREEHTLARYAWEAAAEPEGFLLAGVASDEIDPRHKLTRLWGSEAGRATRVDRLLVLGATELGRRRAIASASVPIEWSCATGGPAILERHAADVPPRRSRVDGSARAHEEPRPRADDLETAQLHPPGAGAPVRA
jgi:DNA methylase